MTWSDVGGLEDVKQAILDTIELPLKHRWVTGHQAATPAAAQADTGSRVCEGG